MSTTQNAKNIIGDIDILVGKNLKALRKARGLSQSDLGRTVDVSFQQIQKYENGRNRITASNLYALADALKVDMSSFFQASLNSTLEISDHAENQEHHEEVLEIIRAYEALVDEGKKRALLDFVKALSKFTN